MERAGSGDPALSGKDILWCFINYFLPELPYFFLQVHFSDGSLHPTHTPFLIAMPQVLHGSHPQVWHMETPPSSLPIGGSHLSGFPSFIPFWIFSRTSRVT